MEPATIIVNGDECYFQQGDLKFPVHRYNLDATLGTGQFRDEGSVLDRLPESILIQFARANDFEIDPFDRDLVRLPLLGVIEFTWKKHFGHITTPELIAYYEKNHRNRVDRYHRRLKELRDAPRNDDESHPDRRWVRTYRIVPNSEEVPRKGRDREIYNIVRDENEVTFAKLMELARNRVSTKSKLEYVVGHFVNSLVQRGALELVGSPIQPIHKEKTYARRNENRRNDESQKPQATGKGRQAQRKEKVVFEL